MFEGIVANVLNKYLGKYIQDLDSQNLQVGIFGGKVELTDLTLKPEALYELNLPIEVKAGYVGKITVDIDWFNLFSKPAIVTVQDVYALAGPIVDRKYDATLEAALGKVRKHSVLEELERNNATTTPMEEGEEKSQGFMESMVATLINNIQVTVERIHIRYEDKITTPGHAFACGVMLNTLAAETTDAEWRPAQVDGEAATVHKVVRLSGLSVYWNPNLPDQSLVRNKTGNTVWRNLLRNSIDARAILEEEFEFILLPISAVAKLVLNKGVQETLPKLLVDFFMDDIGVMATRQQFLNMLCLQESFKLMAVNQRYRKYHPGVTFQGHIREWWHYAYTAVVEEKVKPMMWQYIKAHRAKFKKYKETYKKWLRDPSDTSLQAQLDTQEEGLDVANITIARGQAKYEFAREAPPTPKTEKPKKEGWWSWLTGGSSDDEDEEEPAVQPDSENWLNDLTPDERSKLYEAVGFVENGEHETNPEYVAHRVNLDFGCCSLSLVNYSKEVLKLTVKQFTTTMEHRPNPMGVKLSTSTEAFSIEGVSLEHDLVPLVTSDVGVYPSSQRKQVFSAEFEMNPLHVQSDFAVAMNVQPVEIVYDEHAVTEMLAFLQVPHLTPDEMGRMVTDRLYQLQEWSRAGLQHAIHTHKTLHVSMNMRSPYLVIPEYGTLHRGGNVLVLDLGKLKVESKPQTTVGALEELTLSEVEARLYDRYSVTITEVKALLADSGEDWHTAQTKPDSAFHILPSVAVQLTFFNSVQPEYTDLPRHKLEAKVSTLKLHLSDENLEMLADFLRHIPVPHSYSMMGLDDSIDGHLDPVLSIVDERDLQREPSVVELKKMKRSCFRNSAVKVNKSLMSRASVMSTDSDAYFSASDHSDEEIEEWAGGLDVANLDEHSSKTNKVSAVGRFILGDVLIQISKSADKIDTPYLMLRINRVCADASKSDYGVAMHARLGGIQLVDKIHQGALGEYLEVLSSNADTDLITVSYRKVEPECPEFHTVYQSIEQGMSVKLSSVKLTFHRAAILYLNTFVQGLLHGMQSTLGPSTLRRSTSTILSAQPGEDSRHHQPDPPNFLQRLSSQADTVVANNITQMHIYAKIEDISIKLCDHEMDFATLNIAGLEGKVSVKAARTMLQARLSDLAIEDLTESTLHPKVLSIDDDNAFDFKLVKYTNPTRRSGNQNSRVDGSAKLRIGKIQGVFLNKFISEITGFMEPFMNPEVTQQYKVAAQNAAYNTIADAQEQGTKYSFCIDLKSPTILVPQNSASTNVIVLKLGDLSIKNYFEDTEVGGGVLQKWDHIYLNLESVCVLRGKLSMNGVTTPQHTIIEPIHLKLDLKRALPPHRHDIYYELEGQLHKVKVNLMPTDLKVVMAVMRENLTESGHMPPYVDSSESDDQTSPFTKHESLDTTTPVVEIEEPLLSAPEVSELVKDATFNFDLEGIEINLRTEEEAHDEEGQVFPQNLAQFDISNMRMTGTVHKDKTMEIGMSLKSIDLEDVRESSNLAIKRIIQSSLRPRGSYDESPPVIQLWYKKKEDNNTHLDVEIETLRINACVPYLLTIKNFFMQALSAPEATHNVPVSLSTFSMPASRTHESIARTTQAQAEETAAPESWTITSQFKQPEIVLFAEPTQKNSRALVLKASGNFNYYYVNGKEDLDAKLKQVKVISGVWGEAKQTASMVMHPCSIEFTRHRDSNMSPIIMNLKLSDMYLNVNATTLHIFFTVYDVIQKDQIQGTGPGEASDPATRRYYDLWHTKSVSREEWLKPEDDDNKQINFPDDTNVAKETLHVDIPKLQLMFEVENLDYNVPRLCVKSEVKAEAHDWSTQLRSRADVSLEVLYFNDKLSVWEPLLEPVMVAEDHYRPWQLSLKMAKAESHPIACTPPKPGSRGTDELDSAVSYWLQNVSRGRVSSSETESDEGEAGTEMTVIRTRTGLQAAGGAPGGKARNTSAQSYANITYEDSGSSDSEYETENIDLLLDSGGHHNSLQGESDSDSELIDTLSSGLESMLSTSDSSDELSDGEDDLFDSPEKPVFLTAKGPVHLTSETGEDVVDGMEAGGEELKNKDLCTYVLIDSLDQLLVNVTPHALDVLTEILEAWANTEQSVLKSVQDLPGFEVYNNLGVEAELTFDNKVQSVHVDEHWKEPEKPLLENFDMTRSLLRQTSYYKPRLHRARLSALSESLKELEEPKLVEIEDEDELDGMYQISKALASSGSVVVAAGLSVPDINTYTSASSNKKEFIDIKLDGFDDLRDVSHHCDVRQLIPLQPSRDGTTYAMVYDVGVTHGRKVMTLRSPLQVYNHLNVAVELYCEASELQHSCVMLPTSTPYTRLETLQPHTHYDVPLFVAYHCKLFVKPLGVGVAQTEQGVWWQDFLASKDRRKQFSCQPASNANTPFQFKVVCEDGKAGKKKSAGAAMTKSTPHYNLHIHPPIILHNLLPYHLSFTLQNLPSKILEKGDNTAIHTANLNEPFKLNLQLSDYLGADWHGSFDLNSDLEEFKAITMECENNGEGQSRQTSLSIHTKNGDFLDLYVYTPYWIINKTALPVQIRGSRSEVVHENGESQDPLLFRFKKYKRKKAKLRVHNSKWTKSFSLDTIASNGVVICNDKERKRKYHFMLQIQMSKLRLTKIVTILPYFLVVNNTDQDLRFMEDNANADLWNDIAPEKCIPFWPTADSYKMFVQFKENGIKSQHFSITNVHNLVLRMDKGSALCVDIAGGTDTSFTITFRPYEMGDAPVRIENLCEDVFIKLFQKNHSHVTLLSPCQSVLYTWDDPTLERTLMWNSVNRKQTSFPAEISKDGCGSQSLTIQTVKKATTNNNSEDTGLISSFLRRSKSKELSTQPESSTDDDSDTEMLRSSSKSRSLIKRTRTDKVQVHWVSYLDAGQRVLLFSQDERISKRATKMSEAEPSNMEVFISLSGIGVSLVNALYEEVAFATLTSSPAMWEVEAKRKKKLLNAELASLLEECWRKGQSQVKLEDFLQADFQKMEMTKPFLGSLRRLYNPALWAHYRQSTHHTYLHTRIHRLQVDNQLRDAYFPTVLYPSPAPSFIVKKAGPKPFIECMLLRRTVPERQIDTIKFASALIQEFNIKVDKGFMLSLYDIFAARQEVEAESEQLKADVASTKRDLMDLAAVQASSRPQRIFFEYLHLSPLKLRVSFSLYGNVHSSSATEDNQSLASDVIEFFLTSVGATLTEIKEVELRMAYFQREGVMLTWSQLQSEVQSHYVSQAIKQAYVLLLGLDVLGNPYGLIKDFTKGLGDFFYEPFMGSIEQPDQFAERLSYGMHSLLGHTVGSVAGSVSLVTGSLGRTLAMLSFDDEFQLRRHRYMQQHPKHLPESVYLAGKSFVMGVAMGISGVVTSPVRGGKEEGMEGFFKGIGKGLLGLLTKPTGGAVDMVSMAFDGIRRTAEMGEDVVMRIRVPRFINPLLGVRPFSYYQSVGMRILNNIGKGRYMESDTYWAHAPLSKTERADVLLITDKRVLLLEKCKFWGDWDIDWDVQLADMLDIPGVSDGKLIVRVKKDEDAFDFMSSDTYEAESSDQELLLWLQKKIDQVVIFVNEH